MATVDIKNLNNEVIGKLDLADAVFAGPINEGLMHQAVKQYLASRDRKSTRLNSSHIQKSRMPSSA